MDISRRLAIGLVVVWLGYPIPSLAQSACGWPDCTKSTTSGRSATAPGNYFQIQDNHATVSPLDDEGYYCAQNLVSGRRIVDNYVSTGSSQQRWLECDGSRPIDVPSMPPFHLSFAFSNIAFSTLLSGCLPRWPQAATTVTPCPLGTAVTNTQKLGITVNRAHDWVQLTPRIGHLTCTVSSATGVDAGDQLVFEVLHLFGPDIKWQFSQSLILDSTLIGSANPTAELDIDYQKGNVTTGDSLALRVSAISIDTGTAMTAISGHCELYGNI